MNNPMPFGEFYSDTHSQIESRNIYASSVQYALAGRFALKDGKD